MPALIPFKYRAFLSYAHANKRWAKWLHRQLERFPLDKDLVGRETSSGVTPSMLRPIFRDRDDFTAGHTLTEQTLAALDSSAALIILCSPEAARSHYVNEEIRLFKWRHPKRPVIPVIVDGIPHHSERDCFAPALKFRADGEGVVTNDKEEVLAADVREEGDGRSLALAKAVARLLGLQTDEVFRRAERARRRSLRIRNGVIAGLALLAVAAFGSAVVAWQNATAREAMLVEAIGVTNSVVEQVVKLRDYVPRAVVESLLTQADDGFSRLLAQDVSNDALRAKYGGMLFEFARHYNALGLATKHKDRAERSYEIFLALHKKSRQTHSYRHGLAAALTEIGNAEITLGNLTAASAYFDRARQLLLDGLAVGGARKLTVGGPSEPLGRRQLLISGFGSNIGATRSVGPRPVPKGVSDELHSRWLAAKVLIRSGDVAFEQGKFVKALADFRGAMVAIEVMRSTYAYDLSQVAVDFMLYDLGVALIRIGDVYRESTKWGPGGEAYSKAQRYFKALIYRQRGNKDFERMEAVTSARIGLILRQRGQFSKSYSQFERAIQTYERLLVGDPKNSGWKRDLQVTLGNFGESLLAAGDASQAKKIFLRSAVLATEIVRLDETNRVWRNDLAIADIQVGLAELRLGDTDAAKSRLLGAKRELEALVRADPTNEIWRLELKSLEALLATMTKKQNT